MLTPCDHHPLTPLPNERRGFTKWYYPEVFAVIDLGQPYALDELWGYHQYGGAHFQLEAGNDLLRPTYSQEISTNPSPTVPNPVKHWEQSWASVANFSGVTARYLSVRLYSPTNIFELVVYGTAAGPPPPPPPPPGPPRKAPLMRSFLGVNGFVDDPITRLNVVGAVREYQVGTALPLFFLSYPRARCLCCPGERGCARMCSRARRAPSET